MNVMGSEGWDMAKAEMRSVRVCSLFWRYFLRPEDFLGALTIESKSFGWMVSMVILWKTDAVWILVVFFGGLD
jgi:hypothetical protein